MNELSITWDGFHFHSCQFLCCFIFTNVKYLSTLILIHLCQLLLCCMLLMRFIILKFNSTSAAAFIAVLLAHYLLKRWKIISAINSNLKTHNDGASPTWFLFFQCFLCSNWCQITWYRGSEWKINILCCIC